MRTKKKLTTRRSNEKNHTPSVPLGTVQQIVIRGIKKAAKKYRVSPHDVTPAQFWSVAESVSEWDVRKFGGFTAIRDLHFPIPPESDHGILPRITTRKETPPRKPTFAKPINKKLVNFTVHESVDLHQLFRISNIKNSGTFKVVVQPDTHVPDHDETALAAFLEFCRDYKPHGYINLGDFVEMDSLSRWDPKTSKPRRLAPEIRKAREVLKQIDNALGPQCVYRRFLMGNHEDWLEQYLIARVPEFFDDLDTLGVELTVPSLLGLRELGFRVVPFNEILNLGHLHFIHGYYTNKYHAHKHLEVFGVNLMYGHLHDVQSYSGVSVNGIYESLSVGCLRTLHAPFLRGRPNNWIHAFGVVEFRVDGTYTRYVPIIIDGKFSFNGVVYDGRKIS